MPIWYFTVTNKVPKWGENKADFVSNSMPVYMTTQIRAEATKIQNLTFLGTGHKAT